MKSIYLLFSILSCALFYSQWSHIGLNNKTVKSIAASEASTNIYAIADNQLYKADAIGSTWNLISISGVLDFKYVFVDKTTDKLYLGANNGIYVSDNGGSSFQDISNQIAGNGVMKILVTDNEIIVYTPTDVFKTNKINIQWQNITGNLTFFNFKDIDFYNGNYYLSQTNGLYKSSGDNNWQLLTNRNIAGFAVMNDVFYIATQGGCTTSGDTQIILKSMDLGQNWVNITPQTGVYHCTSHTIFSHLNRLFVGNFYGSGYQSLNNGQTVEMFTIAPWVTINCFERKGTNLLAGTEYYTHTGNPGGVYVWNGQLSTNDIKKQEKISVYPVPSKDFVFIENEDKNEKTVTIYNSSGQLLDKFKTKESRIKIDLQKYEIGIYFLNIASKEKTSVHKIIKE